MIAGHCHPDPCTTGHASIPRGRSIVLPAAEWSRIVGHLQRDQLAAQHAEQQRQYAEYLRTGSEAMTSTWTNTHKAIRQRKQEERRDADEAHVRDGEERFKALKEADEKVRMERIAAAQKLIERVKVGPRQLESAYLFADVLQTRQLQREMNAQERRAQCVRKMQAGREQIASGLQGTVELAEMIAVRRRAQDGYKREMLAHICAEKQRLKAAQSEEMAAECRYRFEEAEALRKEEEEQKRMIGCKKAAEKERIFEEIRGKRDKESKAQKVEAIEDKIVSIYARARDINFMRNRHHRTEINERNAQRHAAMSAVFTQLVTNTAQQTVDYEERRRAQCAAQQEERDRERDAADIALRREHRAVRQQAQAEELQAAEQRRREALQERQSDVANRFRNEEVSAEYTAARRSQERDKRLLFRRTMQQQMAEREERVAAEKRQWQFVQPGVEEDAQFFEMAAKLMDEADAKKRPLLPLRRCVQQYRRENGLGEEVEEGANGAKGGDGGGNCV